MKNLFVTRNFWIALLTLVVLFVGTTIPDFALDIEHAAGLAVVVGGYMVAYAVNPSGVGLAAILMSRKFWLAALGFVVLVLDAFHIFPNPLDVEALVGFVVLVVAYMIALANDPGNGWRGLLVSRKFWAAVVGIVLTFLQAFSLALPMGLTTDQIVGVVVLFAGVIASAGIEGPPEPMPDPVIPSGEPLSGKLK